MNTYHLTFIRNSDPDNIQRETLIAENIQQIEAMYQATDCTLIRFEVKADAESASAPDHRIARRESILAAFRDEPLSKDEAAELYTELAEIDQALQFHPSDTCQDYITAAWDKMESIQF